MLFNFSLAPLDRIQPWGEVGHESLSWFGLTYGQYWIQVGDGALLEYSEAVRARWPELRYCDYQIVRLYEDIGEMVPWILEPVPDDLARHIGGGNAQSFFNRIAAVTDGEEATDDDDPIWETRDIALTWVGHRALDTGYLSPRARIYIWSDANFVYFDWDNTGLKVQDDVAWSAMRGSFKLPRAAFSDEIRSFHLRLMQQMDERVRQVLDGALSPHIRINHGALEDEQQKRCASFDRGLITPPIATDWDSVRLAVAEILAKDADDVAE